MAKIIRDIYLNNASYRVNTLTDEVTAQRAICSPWEEVTGSEAELVLRKLAARTKSAKASAARRDAYASVGMVRVRGNHGGTYWE